MRWLAGEGCDEDVELTVALYDSLRMHAMSNNGDGGMVDGAMLVMDQSLCALTPAKGLLMPRCHKLGVWSATTGVLLSGAAISDWLNNW